MTSLQGKKILLTRPVEKEDPILSRLIEERAEVISLPLIRYELPESWQELDHAIGNLSRFDVLLFTSAMAASCFVERWTCLGCPTISSRLIIAAVGSRTGNELKRGGIALTLLPKRAGSADNLEEALQKLGVLSGKKILFPRAEVARERLVQFLKKNGAEVTLLPVYRTRPDEKNQDLMRKKISKEKIDWILFGSGSAVRSLIEALGEKETKDWIQKMKILLAAIGKETELVLSNYGLHANVVPNEPTFENMIEAMKKWESEEKK